MLLYWPQGYETFVMLNSIEHKIYHALKYLHEKTIKARKFFIFQQFSFYEELKFLLDWVKQKNVLYITSRLGSAQEKSRHGWYAIGANDGISGEIYRPSN